LIAERFVLPRKFKGEGNAHSFDCLNYKKGLRLFL
jgi:hypothetical protein